MLVISGVLETVWAIALERSAGFSRLVPTVIFAAAATASMIGLGYALREIPVGTGYAVWVGIGAAGTALIGMVWLGDPATVPRLLLVVAGVIGLKFLLKPQPALTAPS